MGYSQQRLKNKDRDNSNPKDSQTTGSHKTSKTDLSKPSSFPNQNLLEGPSLSNPSDSTTKQPASSSRLEENDSPNRVGIEQELVSVTLTLITGKSSPSDQKSGVKLAETYEKTFSDLPVFKLETEGGHRGPLCIELIYGPLQMKEYNEKSLKEAKEKLSEQLSKKQDLKEALYEYNKNLGKRQERYRLKIDDAASEKYRISKPSAKIITNKQTNVAIPYSNLGRIPQKGKTGFEEMFGIKEQSDKKLYEKAREEAEIIKKKMETIPNDKYLQSLLTHVIFQEAKFIYHRIDKEKISIEDKQHFHVMLKLSPEDAIVTILSKQENEALGKWLKEENGQLQKSIKNTLGTLSSSNNFQINVESIKNQLEKAISARSKGAEKLELVNTDEKKSKALDKSNDVIKDENDNDITIGHTHPRPTNRIPVYSHNDEHYMVVEQRSLKHMLNVDDVKDKKDNFDAKNKLIARVSSVPTAAKVAITPLEG